MQKFTGLIGLAVILSVAFFFSTNRRAIQPRIVLWGLGLQFSFAFLVLKTPLADAFTALSNGINHLLGYASEGSKFVFGNNLGAGDGGFATHAKRMQSTADSATERAGRRGAASGIRAAFAAYRERPRSPQSASRRDPRDEQVR